MLCDQVGFEQGTQKPHLLGVFTGLAADAFPTLPRGLTSLPPLSDGLGEVTITLSVVRLDTDQEIYSQKMKMRFPAPMLVVNLRFRIRRLVFDAPGTYLLAPTVDDEEIAALPAMGKRMSRSAPGRPGHSLEGKARGEGRLSTVVGLTPPGRI
jgi:hypothetical protein